MERMEAGEIEQSAELGLGLDTLSTVHLQTTCVTEAALEAKQPSGHWLRLSALSLHSDSQVMGLTPVYKEELVTTVPFTT
jgi:hypothetical protein